MSVTHDVTIPMDNLLILHESKHETMTSYVTFMLFSQSTIFARRRMPIVAISGKWTPGARMAPYFECHFLHGENRKRSWLKRRDLAGDAPESYEAYNAFQPT